MKNFRLNTQKRYKNQLPINQPTLVIKNYNYLKQENTIRKMYGLSIDKNSVHGSDSPDNAKKEIEFFFNN